MAKNKTACTKKRITRQLLDIKRHVQGYVVGGDRLTVAQTRKLAERDQIFGVQPVGRHIQAIPGRKTLSSLPFDLVRRNSKGRLVNATK